MIIALLILVTTITIVLARTIIRDGYGTRPAPRSHRHDQPQRWQP